MLYFLQIIKLRIIFGNVFCQISSYFFTSNETIFFEKIFFSSIGMSFIIASACILNNIFDRKIDRLMVRTKHRVFAKKLLDLKFSFLISFLLLILGSFVLLKFLYFRIFLLNLIGFFIYVFLYTLILKKKSVYSVLVGSLSGALPYLIGCCLSKNPDYLCGLILFFVLIIWQQIHFFAISLLHFQDYKKAKIPVFVSFYPIEKIIKQMCIYNICFIILSGFLLLLKFKNKTFFWIFLISSIFWMFLIFRLKKIKNLSKNSNYIFKYSLIQIFLLNFFMILNHFL